MKIRLVIVAGCLAVTPLFGGCAVYMAANQPSEKNLALLKPGTPRNLVVTGAPNSATTRLRGVPGFKSARFFSLG